MLGVSVLLKPASSLCNMRCDYCFYCDEAENRERRSFGTMSEETLRNVIRRTLPRAERAASYAYQGGEPTLRGLEFFQRAVAYQRQYNTRGVAVSNSFQTNGYLLDEAWCDFFRENDFLVGLSVDGTPEIHDALRHDRRTGGGTANRVLRAAGLMRDRGVSFNILTVVTPEIARNVPKIYACYRKKGWDYQQYIACLDPLGGGHGQAPHALAPELYGRFLCELFALWLRDLERGRQPYIRQFENWLGLAAGYRAEACDQCGTCGIQNVVEADGSVYPCDFYALDEYRLGNFNVDRMDAIDARREEIGFLERSRRLDPACGACEYYRLCRGGCQRTRDLDPASGLYKSYFCGAYRMFFERWGKKLEELAAAWRWDG